MRLKLRSNPTSWILSYLGKPNRQPAAGKAANMFSNSHVYPFLLLTLFISLLYTARLTYSLLVSTPSCSMKEMVHSRAYLRFVDPQDVLRFTHAIHGHAFVTDRGTQFR